MLRVEMDPENWRKGWTAGLAGGRAICPPDVLDRLAYQSGFIEGKAVHIPRAVVRRGRQLRRRTARPR
jgi:hypothetical protein